MILPEKVTDDKGRSQMFMDACDQIRVAFRMTIIDELERKWGAEEIEHKCHNCTHYLQGEYDGSCGSYICKEYSGWEQKR